MYYFSLAEGEHHLKKDFMHRQDDPPGTDGRRAPGPGAGVHD